MMKYKSPDTICGTVSNIAREGEEAHVMTLKAVSYTHLDVYKRQPPQSHTPDLYVDISIL